MNINRRHFIKILGLSPIFLYKIDKLFKVNNNYLNYPDDEKIFIEKIKFFKEQGFDKRDINDCIFEIGNSFLDTEYVAGTLDNNIDSEELVVNLQGFDCVTFVENCLAFARCLKKKNDKFENFKDELKNIRYRDGIISGYPSRLHYFCDWIYDNEQKGIIQNVSKDLGDNYSKTINFMSKHRSSYKQLKDNDNFASIKEIEDNINSRKYYHVPKKKISGVYSDLKNGDIIATTTNIEGLDVTHTGYVYKVSDSEVYFLHASSKSKKVIVSNDLLADYVSSDSKKIGIMVARPMEV
jgi:hypothetical protein